LWLEERVAAFWWREAAAAAAEAPGWVGIPRGRTGGGRVASPLLPPISGCAMWTGAKRHATRGVASPPPHAPLTPPLRRLLCLRLPQPVKQRRGV
jgi:hypothetical protein